MLKTFILSSIIALASAAHNILDQKNVTVGPSATVDQEFANARAF